MSLKSPQDLQQMIAALTKRVTDLEKYVRSVQKAAAAKGIKLPTL